jgi:CheY-like chemotaxis protein
VSRAALEAAAMYDAQTERSGAVHAFNAAECGRILVIDDDRVFGGFMMAALESRGHEVDWAACIQDGLASLYARRYDLAIIDLRLPDGSGLDFLRDATDEGLFEHTSAIILTGHDFEEPSDIRVFRKSLDLDPFLDRMANIVAATKKRKIASTHRATQPPAIHRGLAFDRHRPRKGARIDLVLYTSAASEKSQRALRTIHRVLDNYDAHQVNLTICDLADQPAEAEEDSVVFTPTLVKRGPGPRTWIVGNLDQDDLLIDLLDVSGVDRKRDGRY